MEKNVQTLCLMDEDPHVFYALVPCSSTYQISINQKTVSNTAVSR